MLKEIMRRGTHYQRWHQPIPPHRRPKLRAILHIQYRGSARQLHIACHCRTTPQRPLLPAVSLVTPNPGNIGYGNRNGTSIGPQSTRLQMPPLSTAERLPDGRTVANPRPRPPIAPQNTTNSRIACYKCQGWGHFASQCPSQRQATRPARALLVESMTTSTSRPRTPLSQSLKCMRPILISRQGSKDLPALWGASSRRWFP